MKNAEIRAPKAPKVAYRCQSGDPEETRIIFAASNASARRSYVAELDPSRPTVTRAPDFDRFAPGPIPMQAYLDDGWHHECSCCYRMISLRDDFVEDMPSDHLAETARINAPVLRDLDAFDAADPPPAPAAADATPQEKWRVSTAISERARRRGDIACRLLPDALSRAALRIHEDRVFCDIGCERRFETEKAKTDLAHRDAEIEAERRWPGATEYASSRWPILNPRVSFKPPGLEWAAIWSPEADDVHVATADLPAWKAFLDSRRAA